MFESPTVAARFWKMVRKLRDDECWPWLGGVQGHGYGAMQVGTSQHGRMVAAHRVAWELQVGPIPEGFEPDHTCRNKLCQNAGHMELVTHAENGRRGSVARWAGRVIKRPGTRPKRAMPPVVTLRGEPCSWGTLHDYVLRRDQVCTAWRLGFEHRCMDRYGFMHDPMNTFRLTLDHVPDAGHNAFGKRAPHDELHLVAMCAYMNVDRITLTIRDAERAYLDKAEPARLQTVGDESAGSRGEPSE